MFDVYTLPYLRTYRQRDIASDMNVINVLALIICAKVQNRHC